MRLRRRVLRSASTSRRTRRPGRTSSGRVLTRGRRQGPRLRAGRHLPRPCRSTRPSPTCWPSCAAARSPAWRCWSRSTCCRATGPIRAASSSIDWMLTIGLVAASRVAWRAAPRGAAAARRLAARAQARAHRGRGPGGRGPGQGPDGQPPARRRGGGVRGRRPRQAGRHAARAARSSAPRRTSPEIRRRRPIDQVIVAIPSAPPRVLRRIAELARGVARLPRRPAAGIAPARQGRRSCSRCRCREETFLSRNAVDLAAAELPRFFEGKKRPRHRARAAASAASWRASSPSGSDGPRASGSCSWTARRPRSTTSTAQVGAVPRRRGRWPVLASVRDLAADGRAARDAERPDVILHAAALKHVPMCEEHPLEAMRHQPLGHRRVWPISPASCGVPNFTLVSTDKAVAPSCVMGASKRAAETYVQSLAPGSPDPLRRRPLRQRAGLERQRAAPLPRADRARAGR